jgi:hypothetical protein
MNKYVVLTTIVAGLVTWLFMYIDARLFDTPKTKFTYVKGITFVMALVGTIVYFMGMVSSGSQLVGNFLQQPRGVPVASPAGTVNVGDMLTGLPPF